MRYIVENWLKENDIPYTDIIYSSKDKLDICIEKHIDIMIEDKLSTLSKIKKYIPVICFDAPYNKEIDDNNLFRVFDLNEVLNIIKKEK